jgi:hypothetical protein
MSTAVSAAVVHPDVQSDLIGVIQAIDRCMRERMEQAIADGQLPSHFDAPGRATVAQSLLHSLSLRARAGEPKANLRRLIRSGVEAVLS